MRKRTLAREYALQILYQHELNPTNLQEAVASFWEASPEIGEEVRTFAEKLVFGTAEKLKDIDAFITGAVQNWDLKRIAVLDRNILRSAVYELMYCQDIPPKVTINEAVNLAKKFSQEESGKFVNGILDNINHTQKPVKSQHEPA